ncbi:methylated-DNA--[protein]-cysteine S-methyltransferase [Streptomyces sp. DSM 44917]|uniref:Methylated-DNA--protein-cysteine methyltransferase n=1 Tax=Streptomyces boetiae TaxID=3075541 RepID=A0ABU2L5A4_9ACTN|nr:methylated-DNA--[protein]-cysteine S-methyltransferase [Streptomyces sp. DSM 44917]MDT0306705.1 methylated-DNA--[protein]-cysteine S-methyltransferase [Streptomyces sp. DSM 44917]
MNRAAENAAAPDAAPDASAVRGEAVAAGTAGGERPWSWTVRPSPIGPLLLAATGAGLVRVVFHADQRGRRRALGELEALLGSAPSSGGDPVLDRATAQLEAYFAGGLRAFRLPLDWSLASGYGRRALRELAASVPFGSVVTYGELAARVRAAGGGGPASAEAARAVGAAMGANPLPVVVPCHRVVASGGALGGFGGGLETKRALLALEGVLPAPLF